MSNIKIIAPIPVVLLGSRYLFKTSWPFAIGAAIIVGGSIAALLFKQSFHTNNP